ncbi:MAG TPA: tetratricopeptide repeat protein [Stellaceae bacterium]|jgi:localization factor PodJL
MIRDISLFAVDGADPWQSLALDAATRRLAEHAAAAAGLAIEDWLERAIRRACSEIAPPVTEAVASDAVAPDAVAPDAAAATEPPAATVIAIVPATPAPILVPPSAPAIHAEIDAALAALVEMAQRQHAPPPAADDTAAATDEAEQSEAAAAEPLALALEAAPDPDTDGEPIEGIEWLLPNTDGADTPRIMRLEALPPARSPIRGLIMIACGIALSITAGALTAQYLIPGPAQPVHVTAQATTLGAPIVASLVDPALARPSAQPSAAIAPPAAAAVAPSPALPQVPGLPPTNTVALTDLAALPPPLPPSAAVKSAAAPQPKPDASEQAMAPPPSAAPSPPAAKPDALLTAKAPPAAKAKAIMPANVVIAPIAPLSEIPPADPKALAPWLAQRAKAGDAIAQYRLGVLYALGEGVQQDYHQAAQLFKTAADGGVAEAQYNVAVMYGQGLGIGRDPALALKWYEKAAAQGSANAAFNLGVAYSNGLGVPQSMDQAVQWFRRAATDGIINAQFNLAVLYERGTGVPASPVEAFAWYSAAAARGDSGAAERRDHLAGTLSPAVLKEAQARAKQIATTIQSASAAPSAALPQTASAIAGAAPKP